MNQPPSLECLAPTPGAPLSGQQQNDLCALVAWGAHPHTACGHVGCTPAELRIQLRIDRAFRRAFRRAEASAEINRLRNVHDAASNHQQWRAAAWWLERRAPDRYGGCPPAEASEQHIADFLEAMSDAIADAIDDEQLRSQLLARLDQFDCPLDP